MTLDVPESVIEEIEFFRYRERFKLSHNEAAEEPAEEIRRAILIWSLDDERAKLEEGREQRKRARS